MKNIAFHRYTEFSTYFVAPKPNAKLSEESKENHTYNELSPAALTKAIAKFAEDLETAKDRILAGLDPLKVIFTTNRKLNGIYTVKTLPVLTCTGICGKCAAGCYAVKNENLFAGSRAIAAHNTAVLELSPETYFKAIAEFTATQQEFRYHEAGEVTDMVYMANVITIARNNSNCDFLLYTKRLDSISEFRALIHCTKNLHVVASCMDYADLEKTANLGVPRTIVDYSHKGVPAKYYRALQLPYGANVYSCKSDCSVCKHDNTGCWNKQTDHITVFEAHN